MYSLQLLAVNNDIQKEVHVRRRLSFVVVRAEPLLSFAAATAPEPLPVTNQFEELSEKASIVQVFPGILQRIRKLKER